MMVARKLMLDKLFLREMRLHVWASRHQAELLLGLRMLIAAVLTFAISSLFRWSQSYWGVLTVVIVMQPSLGSAFKATVERIIGSIGGAVWAVAVSLAIPHTGFVAEIVGLALALAPLAVIAGLRPEYRIAPITAIIVLLSSFEQQGGASLIAVHRIAEILLGCAVAFAVTIALPAPAYGLLIKAAKRALDLFAADTTVLFAGLLEPVDTAAAFTLGESIPGAIAKLEVAAVEVARERAQRLTAVADPQPLVRTLRRLRHDLAMLGRAASEPLPAPIGEEVAESVRHAATRLSAYLRAIGDALAAGAPAPPTVAVDLALSACAAKLEEAAADGNVARVFGVAFALTEMRQNLDDLARVTEMTTPERGSSLDVAARPL